MSRLWIFMVILIGSACSQNDAGQGLILFPNDMNTHTPTYEPYPNGHPTALPSLLPNLRVVSVENKFFDLDPCQESWYELDNFATIEIINDGQLDLERYFLRFNGREYWYLDLAAGQTVTLQYQYPKTEMQISVMLDPRNKINEIYESDNAMDVFTITATPPAIPCQSTPQIKPT